MRTSETTIRDPVGGANQSGLRDQNARVVLSFIRRHGELPGAEIARRSGLSAQTVSNIVRTLETEGLVKRGKAIKGKVGKPSVPVALNANGVSSLGLNVGRRSSELVLVDFNGKQLGGVSTSYDYPVIEDVFGFLADGTSKLLADRPEAKNVLAGIGVARPNRLWDWLEVVNAPSEAMRKWQDFDIVSGVRDASGLDVFIQNDATSACVAEHLLGRGSEFSDFAYIFLGAFVGSGLVLNGKIVSGPTGNAASLGPLPVPNGDGGTTQLLNVASLYKLENTLSEKGIDNRNIRQNGDDWAMLEGAVAPWLDDTGRYLAIAAAAIASVVEVEAILIDGAMPDSVRQRLTSAVQDHMQGLNLTGIEQPRIEEGSIGKGARSIGAALLPIHSRYFVT